MCTLTCGCTGVTKATSIAAISLSCTKKPKQVCLMFLHLNHCKTNYIEKRLKKYKAKMREILIYELTVNKCKTH